MKPTQLKLQWLQFFLDTARTHNFTRTAEENFTSQSNVSYAMKSLEDTVGAPLFVRKDNEVTLTKYGEILLPHVEAAFGELGEACKKLDELINPISGEVRIGFSYVFSLDMIPELFRYLYADFAQNNMQVALSSAMAHVDEDLSCVEDLILSGACDLGITCVRAREGCEFRRIGVQELCLLLPKNHPLAGEKSLTLEQVRKEPFILLKGDSNLLGYYERMFEENGIKPKLLNPGLDWLSILLQVSSGQCLTIAPKARYDDYGVAMVKLEHPMKYRDIFVAWPSERKLSPAAKYVRQRIIDYYDK